jgi:hypothetical protein
MLAYLSGRGARVNVHFSRRIRSGTPLTSGSPQETQAELPQPGRAGQLLVTGEGDALAVPAEQLDTIVAESQELLGAGAEKLLGLFRWHDPDLPGEEHKSPEPRLAPWILGSGFSSSGRPGSGSCVDPTSGLYIASLPRRTSPDALGSAPLL